MGTTSFLIKEVKVEEVKTEKVEETTKAKRSRIKMEELTEEEKYRRMREQNNRASQACRAKRKRKLAEEYGARHLAAEEHPAAGRPEGHGEGGGLIQEKDPRAGLRSEKLKERIVRDSIRM